MQKKYSISISYPPLESPKGRAFLSQNRQFQWTNTNNVIYPVIPAYAATLLKQKGYQAYWDDAIAEHINYSAWLKRLKKRQPNLITIETKTPVIKKHWQIIDDIRNLYSKKHQPIIVLMGDHVTALPQESLNNSSVDFVLTGGDYDFMLSNLIDHLNKDIPLEPGFYYWSNKKIINSGKFALKHHNLDELPIIDRKLTKWQLYAYHNTNFKYKPGAYIMSGRDCWWGKCAFCSWTTLFPGASFRSFSVEHTLKEIENLVNNFNVKEIFDDSGTLPTGPWLENFCHELINRGLNKKLRIGCNMRFGALNLSQYQLMYKAGFRFVLYGLESANQKTLDKINKNEKITFAIDTLKIAKKSKLEPHITIMIGYPWESKKDAINTLNLARHIFKSGLADSLQATIIIPYPGTSLFEYCQKNNLLLTTDWDRYDMREPVIKTKLSTKEQLDLIQSLFKGIISPQFIIHKIISIRSIADIKHLMFYTQKYFQKLKDFSSHD
jgi:radical SAM superfamily enzyme YgiQ (UPF0313 family)